MSSYVIKSGDQYLSEDHWNLTQDIKKALAFDDVHQARYALHTINAGCAHQVRYAKGFV